LAAYTVDTLFDPPLTLRQPKTGYRFSLDPLILAAHIRPAQKDRILDIGCGCGILCLILAGRYPNVRITGVEIQKILAELARENVLHNHMQDRVRILHQDVRTLTTETMPAPADWVISNPPYKKMSTGRLNPDPGKALARHDITLDIDTLVRLAHMFLRPRGRLCLIFPASRARDLTAALDREGFHTGWVRPVYFDFRKPARRILVCAVKSGTGSNEILAPLYLYHPDGTPTAAHLALFQW
jgi:tRNA1Val (adenine37-N6)-methyltransferase